MSELGQGPEDAGLAEGGGSGGGSQSVEYQRQIISPWRSFGLVIILIIAVIFIIGPVITIVSNAARGAPIAAADVIIAVLAVIVAVFTLYYLFKKNV